jgi:hypothetical protein
VTLQHLSNSTSSETYKTNTNSWQQPTRKTVEITKQTCWYPLICIFNRSIHTTHTTHHTVLPGMYHCICFNIPITYWNIYKQYTATYTKTTTNTTNTQVHKWRDIHNLQDLYVQIVYVMVYAVVYESVTQFATLVVSRVCMSLFMHLCMH